MSVYASSVSQLLLLIVPSASCFGRYYRPLINCDVTPDTRDMASVPLRTTSMGHAQKQQGIQLQQFYATVRCKLQHYT